MSAILLIDDDDFTRRTIARAIGRAGHEVVEAGSAGAAMQYLREHRSRIDVVVTDVMMPDMDGLELIRGVKAAWPDLRIIAISAGSQAFGVSYLSVAREFGADEILTKPCSAATISAAVARVLSISMVA